MSLKLTFLAPSRLWAEVVNTQGERVFVATADAIGIGDAVSVEVEAPELSSPLALTGTVQGLRPLSGRFPAGVFIKVDAPSLERCRVALHAGRDESARLTGRVEARADCNLPARLVAPVAAEGQAKSLSAHGLTLASPAALDVGAEVRVAVRLPHGAEVQLSARVMWTRAELQLAGLQFDKVEPSLLPLLKRAVEELLDGKPTKKQVAAATVVIADDDPSILDFLSRVVSKDGNHVVPAERGDQALALVRQERPDLVLLDVLMPGLDGLDVCKAMRADAALARIPVVLLSAMGEARLAQAANDAGANDYLTKPMRLEEVRATLAKYLSGRQQG